MSSVPKSSTSEYEIWHGMKQRCGNPNSRGYPKYGGRGIMVCDRWQQFDNFIADMGPRPSPDHTIDRIDNDGPYSPENCRWATWVEQNRNTRSNRIVIYDGQEMCVTEVAERLGLCKETVFWRLNHGFPLDQRRTARSLNEDQVREIRAKYQPRTPGHHCYDLAREFGVSAKTIENVVKRKIWRHVD
jgi:transposase